MTRLAVLQAGPHITVQDEGRPGLLRLGITPGGAIDPLALEEGRLLVGNPPGRAALEIAGTGGRFLVRGERPLVMALTGAPVVAKRQGRGLEHGCSFPVAPGEVLVTGAVTGGTYAYLSVAGGIDVKPVLGSRSTHLRAGFGGFEGRCLQAGDLLPIGAKSAPDRLCRLPEETKPPPLREFRILWAAQKDSFSESERRRFEQTSFEVTHERDRMGMRLASEADPISVNRGLVALSGPVVAGDIQVPGNGRPTVLLADHQPTGGYPRIATIIAADLAAFAQCPVGARVRFRSVCEREAIEALEELSARVRALPDRLQPVEENIFDTDRLLSANLISGVVFKNDQSRDDA